MSSSEASTRRRVKLYVLNDERQWDDKGTGHVSAVCTEQDTMALVVISETDGSYLLESKIQSDTAYQKQQETLIVWSEGENMDLALSFQEKVGCDDVWEKICAVQGKDPSVEITQEVVDEQDDVDDADGYTPILIQSVQPLVLPPCEFSHLEESVELISQAVATPMKRDRLVSLLESTNYLNQLIDLFHKAEDLKEMKSLHLLYEIIRQLILINKHSFYDTLFAEDMLMDVIGMLEYNPAGRKRHRDFIRNKATFREVLPLHNPDLVSKIHQTYRIQYIQECCLPPPCLFDEHTLSQLKSFVSISKLEIIRALQEDEEFMCRLFSKLKAPDTEILNRKELALFAKEFCSISMQTDQKEGFLNCMFQHGALRTAEVLLVIDDKDIRSAALEILHAFIEHQPSVVRGYIYRETAPYRKDDELLINMMINQLLNDTDPELSDAFLLGYMLRFLIDPDNMNNPGVRGEKTEFLSFFYKRCINTLVRPLFENTAKDQIERDDYHTALVSNHILELLTFCIETHTYHMKNYCFNRDLLKRVLVLLQSSHKFLVLAALRLLRRVIHMKEEFYNRYLIKNDLFKPVVKLFVSNGHRYNLLDSAIIELFDYIRAEEITSLITHVIENFWDILKNVNYVQTFSDLKRAYDHAHRLSRPTVVSAIGQSTSLDSLTLVNVATSRFQRDPRTLEMEEEQWFDQDDDDDEDDDSSLYSAQPAALINGSLNAGNTQNSISVESTSETLSSLSRFDSRPVISAVSTSSDFLSLPTLTGAQSLYSLGSIPAPLDANPRDAVFPLALSHPVVSTGSSKSGSQHDTPLAMSNRVSHDRLRLRQPEPDLDGRLRPLPLRQPVPISIHIKSTLPASPPEDTTEVQPNSLPEQNDISRVPIIMSTDTLTTWESEKNLDAVILDNFSSVNKITDRLLQSKKRSTDSEVPTSQKSLKKSRNQSSTTVNPELDVTSPVPNVCSVTVAEPCLEHPLEAAEVGASVGLVDYSDEESEEEDGDSLVLNPKTPGEPISNPEDPDILDSSASF